MEQHVALPQGSQVWLARRIRPVPGAIWIGDLCKAHVGSPEFYSVFFLSIRHNSEQLETWGYSNCVCRIDTVQLVCNRTYVAHRLTLN